MHPGKLLFNVLLLTATPAVAHAYVGPGLGAGAIGVIVGIIGSSFIALFAIIWYPLKRLLKKNRKAKSQSDAQSSNSES